MIKPYISKSQTYRKYIYYCKICVWMLTVTWGRSGRCPALWGTVLAPTSTRGGPAWRVRYSCPCLQGRGTEKGCIELKNCHSDNIRRFWYCILIKNVLFWNWSVCFVGHANAYYQRTKIHLHRKLREKKILKRKLTLESTFVQYSYMFSLTNVQWST